MPPKLCLLEALHEETRTDWARESAVYIYMPTVVAVNVLLPRGVGLELQLTYGTMLGLGRKRSGCWKFDTLQHLQPATETQYIFTIQ